MRSAASGHDVHRDICVGFADHVDSPLNPPRRADQMHVISVSLTQEAFSVTVLVHHGAVIHTQDSNWRHLDHPVEVTLRAALAVAGSCPLRSER